MTLAQLKASIEAEALRRTAAREGFTLEAVKAYLGQGIVVPAEIRAAAPPPPERLTFGWFNALHGREFVHACYSALLGRGADPGGMEHYLAMLARGEDKARILGAIAYSPEGRARNVPVAGLAPRFAAAMAKRVPLVGPVIAWLLALVTLHLRERDARAFEEQVNTRLNAIGEYVGQSSAHVAMRLEALRSVMESRD